MSDRWLEPVEHAAGDGSVLVVCRTSATARAVQRTLAGSAATGWWGLQITTLQGLLHSLVPGRLGLGDAAPPPLLPDHPWEALLRDRPKLTRLLRRHLERAADCATAGRDLGALRPELRALAEQGWGRGPRHVAAARLLEGGRAAVGAPARVFAVGFADGFSFGGTVGPLEVALLAALEPETLPSGPGPADAPSAPLATLRVPDVAAEARAIASAVRDHRGQGEVVVLVPDHTTSERIRAALRRNGEEVADDGSAPLTRHSLAALLEPLLPVFASGGTEPLVARDLLRLLTAPVLSRRPPGRGVEPVPGLDRLTVSIRRTRELVVRCGRVRATPIQWADALDEQERLAEEAHRDARDEDGRTAAARRLAGARIVAARVRVLADAAVEGATLGAIGRAVADLGLSDPGGDAIGRAVVAALKDEGWRPCDEEAWEEALSGSVASGRIDRGVQLLPYAAYDGRPATLLLLAGVHDKGLARAPLPDPLLGPSDSALLGLATPREAVRDRLALALWANSRAGRTVAVFAERDAGGRRVTLPIQLTVELDDSARTASYGLGFDLPERRDRAALGATGAQVDAACLQVDAEWTRAGWWFDDAEAPAASDFDPAADPLNRYLDEYVDRLPADLQGWLGDVGAYPGASGGLPPRFALSATKLTAFTQCSYRAFAASVLALRAPDEIEEDLDSREIGTAVHRALETSLPGTNWVVPDARVEAVRADLLDRLLAATETAVAETAAARLGGMDTPALEAARDGVVARWRRHWANYVRLRIVGVETTNKDVAWSLAHDAGDALDAAVDAIFPAGTYSNAARTQIRKGLKYGLVDTRGELDVIVADPWPVIRHIQGKANQAGARAFLRAPPLPVAVVDLFGAFRLAFSARCFDVSGDRRVVGLELQFGTLGRDDTHAPLTLALGREPIAVRGFIDLVDAREPADGRLRVSDFKTGRSRPGTPLQMTHSLVRPQLPLYALALRELGELPGVPAPVRPEALAYDCVQTLELIEEQVDDEVLDHAAATFGALLDRARDGSYPLLPHPDGCPIRGAKGAYCDFAEVCRLRDTFAPEEDRS